MPKQFRATKSHASKFRSKMETARRVKANVLMNKADIVELMKAKINGESTGH